MLALITRDRILTLRDEALLAGDMSMAMMCDDALNGDDDAHAECVMVIREVEAERLFQWERDASPDNEIPF